MTLAVLLALFGGAPDGPPGATATEAHAHFVRAQRLFEGRQFREALGEFETVNRLSAHELPDIDFNIGQCLRNLGRLAPAVAAFERYLALKPDAPDRRQVRAMVDRMQARLAAKSRLPAPSGVPPDETATAPPDETPEPPPPPRPEPAPAPPALIATQPRPRAEEAAAPVPAPFAPSSDRAESPPIYRRWWFWVAAGAVAVGATAGIYAATHHEALAPLAAPMGTAGTFDTRPMH